MISEFLERFGQSELSFSRTEAPLSSEKPIVQKNMLSVLKLRTLRLDRRWDQRSLTKYVALCLELIEPSIIPMVNLKRN